MFQTDQATAATSLPAPAAAGTPGYFTNGNPATGVAATILDADFMNMIMMELSNVVTSAGITLSKTAYTQVRDAIKRIGQNTVVLADTGAVNAYAATNATPLVADTWVDGVVQAIKIAHANTGASTYGPDGLPAIPIYGLGLQPLQGGELALNGTAILMRATIAGVNSGNPIAVLMECAGGAQQVHPATQSQHAVQMGQLFQSISASVASNALTVGLTGPTALPFRNPTLANGAPVVGAIAASLSLIVPSGATLGTVSGQQANLALLVAYNGGSPVLCVANVAGGLDLSETNLINPTTISAGATSASTIYSASSVSANSPYRVVGYVQITEASAGTWATAPTLVQGVGGEAFSAMQSLGFGQTWQSVVGSRAVGTTYYNTTSRPIFVAINATGSTTGWNPILTVNGIAIPGSGNNWTNAPAAFISAVIPPGGSYVLSASIGSPTISNWAELR
jgi:hypothetical protein